MAHRISQEVRVAICVGAKAGMSHRELAEHYGVSRGSIGHILLHPTVKAARPRAKGIFFRAVPPYFCRGCHAKVNVQPCPACCARRFRGLGGPIQTLTDNRDKE